jgi:uncharacterized membrane protein
MGGSFQDPSAAHPKNISEPLLTLNLPLGGTILHIPFNNRLVKGPVRICLVKKVVMGVHSMKRNTFTSEQNTHRIFQPRHV